MLKLLTREDYTAGYDHGFNDFDMNLATRYESQPHFTRRIKCKSLEETGICVGANS